MPAKKKKPAADTPVAKTAIAIEGKHFDAGAPIEHVSEEELKRAIAARRVITFGEFEGKVEAEPESEAEPEPSSTDSEPQG